MSADPMRLAKPQIDIGLFTNDLTGHLAFWRDQVGLRLDHVLDTGAGNRQHRFDAHGSVVKVNHSAQPLPSCPPSGLAELTIADNDGVVWQGSTPDGSRVRRVVSGTDGIVGIGIALRSPQPQRLLEFYHDALGFPMVAPDAVQCGSSVLSFVEGEGDVLSNELLATGFRYLTVQIFDADAAHRHVLLRGGTEGMPPRTLGDVARFSFVRDPDGNWIELSARSSLIGTMVA